MPKRLHKYHGDYEFGREGERIKFKLATSPIILGQVLMSPWFRMRQIFNSVVSTWIQPICWMSIQPSGLIVVSCTLWLKVLIARYFVWLLKRTFNGNRLSNPIILLGVLQKRHLANNVGSTLAGHRKRYFKFSSILRPVDYFIWGLWLLSVITVTTVGF